MPARWLSLLSALSALRRAADAQLVRSVVISHPQKASNNMNLVEVELWSPSGVNVARSGTATASSVFANDFVQFGPANVIDGSLGSSWGQCGWGSYRIWHSANVVGCCGGGPADPNPWLRVTLPVAQVVTRVRVYLRYDCRGCCTNVDIGDTVAALDDSGQVLASTRLMTYEFVNTYLGSWPIFTWDIPIPPTPTGSGTATSSSTMASSVTASCTSPASLTGTPSSSNTGTALHSATGTASSSATGTSSSSGTDTASSSATGSASAAATVTSSATGSASFSLTASASPTFLGSPAVTQARYVRVEKYTVGLADCSLNIMELQVFSAAGGVNVAVGRPTAGSSWHGGCPMCFSASGMVDDRFDSFWASSLDCEATIVGDIDLGSEVALHSVRYWARYPGRSLNATVSLLGAQRELRGVYRIAADTAWVAVGLPVTAEAGIGYVDVGMREFVAPSQGVNFLSVSPSSTGSGSSSSTGSASSSSTGSASSSSTGSGSASSSGTASASHTVSISSSGTASQQHVDAVALSYDQLERHRQQHVDAVALSYDQLKPHCNG